MIIFLDFDGTVVEHNYPIIGAANPGATDVIRSLQKEGHEIILNTMRADFNDGSLEEAMSYLNSTELDLEEIILFEPKKVQPQAYPSELHSHQKNLFIDDTGMNAPLRPNIMLPVGMMVDWRIVRSDLLRWGLIKSI
ncbi:MAG: hypothetical protein RIT43_1493 [Bacteroidota bacterium]